MAEKPAILRDSRFTVEEGLGYRICRTGAIWMNKLFFSSLVLLGVWLVYGGLTHDVGCAPDAVPTVRYDGQNLTDQGTHAQCSLLLTMTSKFLAGMAVLSFTLSILLGIVGLMFGKRILEATAAADEVGAPPPDDGKPGQP